MRSHSVTYLVFLARPVSWLASFSPPPWPQKTAANVKLGLSRDKSVVDRGRPHLQTGRPTTVMTSNSL